MNSMINKVYTIYSDVKCNILKKHKKDIYMNPPVLLDTGLKSDNAGDDIIMYFALKQLSSLFDIQSAPRIPTHGRIVSCSKKYSNYGKIVCGTNILSTREEIHGRLALPKNVSLYEDSLILLAVGLADLGESKKIDLITGRLYQYILNTKYMHSVRDSNTKQHLHEIGIDNVLNTGCVTMWDLTQEHCVTIPKKKAQNVLTTITDYDQDIENDRYMLKTLTAAYDNVYLWLQGKGDETYFRTLNVSGVSLIRGGFNGLREFVDNQSSIDYFGTRLHCGIYCLNKRIRSMIVSIDNRAADIARDTNIPTVIRENLRAEMHDLIENERDTNIKIPLEAIKSWKEQFKY